MEPVVKYLDTLGATSMLGGLLAIIIWANTTNPMVGPAVLFFGVGSLLIAKAIRKDEENTPNKPITTEGFAGVAGIEYGKVKDNKIHYHHATEHEPHAAS